MAQSSGEPFANLKAKWPHGKPLWDECAKDGDGTFLVAFSRGKDAIAMVLALRDYNMVPFYMYDVPGLSFVEESLDYYERTLFGGRHIKRVLHPSAANKLREGMFHPPHYLATDEAMSLVNYSYEDVREMVAEEAGLPYGAWTAVGTRAADSFVRRKALTVYGPKTLSKHTFQPIWEWNMDMVVSAISRAGVKLPADYQFGCRTVDGLMGEYLSPIKRLFPEDYKRYLEFFPLVEAEVFLYEKAHGIK